MMDLIYTSDNFDETQLQEIDRGIRFMLSVPRGTYPMDRYFGLPAEIMDYPPNTIKNVLMDEIPNLLEIYEPRMQLDSIDIRYGEDGHTVRPVLHLSETEEEDETEGDEE